MKNKVLVGLGLVVIVAMGILVACTSEPETTGPSTVVVATPTPPQCDCAKGKILIKDGKGNILVPPVVKPYEWYLASATQWFNSQGQILPAECSWNQVTNWKEPINGGCSLYGAEGDSEVLLRCTTGADRAYLNASANIGGAVCNTSATFNVSSDDF